jgi:hypothetical protein
VLDLPWKLTVKWGRADRTANDQFGGQLDVQRVRALLFGSRMSRLRPRSVSIPIAILPGYCA